ncbi:MAG: RNA-binding S4 domain-containing protein [Clostridia bacterium]|nr:RNA-binding S4 domain-containing protein [Clostridia bacterium]
MRLDKFLKVSRIVKRRTVAKEICDAGRVKINERPAKAAASVQVGDIISLLRGSKLMQFEILELPERVDASRAKEIYRVI